MMGKGGHRTKEVGPYLVFLLFFNSLKKEEKSFVQCWAGTHLAVTRSSR